MSEETPFAVRMQGIVKQFPGVLANDHVDFDLRPGEIHALLGENGAGKSTLMNILSGLYAPNAGEIAIFGKPMRFRSPRDAIKAGIGMVHQHFMLIESHSVTENVILGLATPRFRLRIKQAGETVAKLGEQYGLHIDPETAIWQLSVGEQQRVEIIKALYRGAKILILDEPTAVLTPQEAEELFRILKHMAGAGHAIIFISHKLDEVMQIADRITVLRKGKVVGRRLASETNKKALARLMVGREVLFHLEKAPIQPGKAVLKVENLQADNDKGLPALKGISFEVREGEILGIAGVAGNGQTELGELLTGLRSSKGGRIFVAGHDLTGKAPRDFIDTGVSNIPESRVEDGSVGNLNLVENLMLKGYRQTPGLFLDYRQWWQKSEKLVRAFDVQGASLRTPARLLSGGNLQKLILARELSSQPRLTIAVHPTQGLDIGATESVRKILLQQRAEGKAILLISEDLEEVQALSDRIAVMYEGTIIGIVPPETPREEIGLMMAGTPHKTETQ